MPTSRAGASHVFWQRLKPNSDGGRTCTTVEFASWINKQWRKRLHQADVDAGGPGFVDRVSKRPAVPHGLRSTFRDWVAERTDYPGDMAEVALAHRVASAVEASYRRGDMVEKRRMLAAWAAHLTGQREQTSKIVRLGAL